MPPSPSPSMSLKLSLTKKSKTFLTTLYNQLHNQPKPSSNQKLSQKTQTVKFPQDNVKSLVYMSPQIRSHVKKLTKRTTFTSPNTTIILYTTPKMSKKFIDLTLNKLNNTVHTIKSLVKNPNPTSITVYLIPAKKTLPTKHSKHPDTLGPNEINSGSTFVIPQPNRNGNVTIWRKEELMRVTIHELLHSLKSDFHLFTTSYLNQKAHETYSIPNDNNININEAYNELNACLFTAALSAPTPQQFFTNIEYERLHSIKLAARVMQYQNTLNKLPPNTSPDWLFDPQSSAKFHQNTNVFSYYIAKTALLYNLNEYISFITSSLQHTYPIFPPSQHHLDDFFSILTKSLTKFRPTLTKLTKTLKYPPKTAKDRSLKMTITGSW